MIESISRDSDLMGASISNYSVMFPEYIENSAWLEHGPFAFWLVDALRPKRFVELGTHGGFSYFAFCQAVKRAGSGTACYAVDSWEGDEHAGKYDDSVYQSVAQYNTKYSAFSTLMKMRFDAASQYFEDGSIDLLHIDGRHFYEDVKEDFFQWLPKLSADAIVLFHDTNVRERDFGVWKFFEELSSEYSTFSFLHGHGLGVLALNRSKIPRRLADLFECSGDKLIAVRDTYSRLGARISTEFQNKRQLQALNAEISRLATIVDGLQRSANSQVVRVEELELLLAEKESGLTQAKEADAQARADLRQQQQEMQQLQSTLSWKITRPLRRIRSMLRSRVSV